jgi:MFS family permease
MTDPRLKTKILTVMCGVVAMTVLDLSVVNVALPSIQAALHVDSADLQWVVVIYGVFVAGFLMLGGRTGDLLGHGKTLVAGITVLVLASFVGGLSGTLGVLVAARAGQGLGAALAAPNALAILSRTFAEGRRATGRWASSEPPREPRQSRARSSAACSCRARAGRGSSF